MISRRAALTGLMLGGAGLATAGVLSGRDARRWLFGPAAFAASPKPLAIPQVIAGEVRDGVRTYALGLQKGVSQFFTGVETPTLGINGAYLGPTLKMRAGELVRMNVTNRIGEPSTIHWHGFHLPARADGGPHQVIRDGETWSPQFVVKQRAAMFWYHSHMVPRTGPQVYHGLAGLIYVDDDETARLDLPSDYGVDDIPLVLQDRAFGNDGSLLYSTSMPSVMMGVRGNVLLVNGTVRPYFEARTSKLRLRILNGSNARSHTVGFADGRTFQQIGTDGGLLERPFETSRITLA
ncbi:MAG: multicopper oxidase domain-containing protein, partial [Algiphilus sp.]